MAVAHEELLTRALMALRPRESCSSPPRASGGVIQKMAYVPTRQPNYSIICAFLIVAIEIIHRRIIDRSPHQKYSVRYIKINFTA